MQDGHGTSRVAVEIAGMRLLFEAADAGIPLGLPGAMSLFRCSPERPDVVAVVRRADLSAPPTGRLVFQSGALWQLWQADDQQVFRFTSPLFGPVPYKVARFDRALTRGQVEIHDGYPGYCPRGRAISPLEYPLDELLLIHWLARGRGLELHACGIVDEDSRGLLFIGHSGAGKTTLSRLWSERRRVTVLSDDRIVVRQEDGVLWMYGTPWHGEAALSAASRAPLAAAFILHHADEAAVVPLAGAEAATQLLARGFVPYHDPEGLAFSVRFVEDLVSRVPCAELHFCRDASFVELVRRGCGA